MLKRKPEPGVDAPGFRPDGSFAAYEPGDPIPEVEIILPNGTVTTPSQLPDDESNVDEEDLDDISDLDDEVDDD